MKSAQLRRLQALEKQHANDALFHYTRDLEAILSECPQIEAARNEARLYIMRYSAEPPRFYRYDEAEPLRRVMWALANDRRARRLWRRFNELLDEQIEQRANDREKAAKRELIAETGRVIRDEESDSS